MTQGDTITYLGENDQNKDINWALWLFVIMDVLALIILLMLIIASRDQNN